MAADIVDKLTSMQAKSDQMMFELEEKRLRSEEKQREQENQMRQEEQEFQMRLIQMMMMGPIATCTQSPYSYGSPFVPPMASNTCNRQEDYCNAEEHYNIKLFIPFGCVCVELYLLPQIYYNIIIIHVYSILLITILSSYMCTVLLGEKLEKCLPDILWSLTRTISLYYCRWLLKVGPFILGPVVIKVFTSNFTYIVQNTSCCNDGRDVNS